MQKAHRFPKTKQWFAVCIEPVRHSEEGDVTRQQSEFKSVGGTLGYCSVKPAQTQTLEDCKCESATAKAGTVKIKRALGTTRLSACSTKFVYVW